MGKEWSVKYKLARINLLAITYFFSLCLFVRAKKAKPNFLVVSRVCDHDYSYTDLFARGVKAIVTSQIYRSSVPRMGLFDGN